MKKTKHKLIKQVTDIEALPPELLFLCFNFLKSPKDLVSLSKTTHRLRDIALNCSLWKKYQNKLPKPVIKLATERHHINIYKCLAVLTNGNLAVGYKNKVWFLETKHFKKYMGEIKLNAEVNTIAALSNNRLAIGCANGTFQLWKLITKNENKTSTRLHKIWFKKNTKLHKFHLERIIQVMKCRHGDYGISVIVSLSNDKLAIGGSSDGVIYIFDSNTGNCIQKLAGHRHQVVALAALTEEKLASSSGRYNISDPIFIWDLNTGQCIRKLRDYHHAEGAVGSDALIALPNNRLAMGEFDRITIWNIDNDKLRKLSSTASRLKLLPSGHLVSWHPCHQYIRFWEISTCKLLYDLKFEKRFIYNHAEGDIAVLHDGSLVCGRSYDGIYIYTFPSIPENCLAKKQIQKNTSYV